MYIKGARWILLHHSVFAAPPDHTTSTMPPKGSKRSAKSAAPAPTPPPPADSSSDDDREPINVYLPGEVSHLQQEKHRQQQREETATWVYNNFRHAAGFAKRVAEHKRKKAGQLPPRKTTVVEPAEGSTQPLHSDAMVLSDEDDVASEVASSKGGSHVTESSSAAKDQVSTHVYNS